MGVNKFMFRTRKFNEKFFTKNITLRYFSRTSISKDYFSEDLNYKTLSCIGVVNRLCMVFLR